MPYNNPFVTDSDSPLVLKPFAAGRFYPAQPQHLTQDVQNYLEQAAIEPSDQPVLSVLTPHAGYPFSGPVAGYSFKYAQNQNPDAVLFVALAHQSTEGGCVFNGEAFETPLGTLEVDRDLTAALLNCDHPEAPVHDRIAPYLGEHSVEVNLPFVQQTFPQAKVASILVSRTDPKLCRELGTHIAETLKKFPEKKVLLTVSSDMSHFPNYETATQIDTQMLQSLETLDPERIWHDLRNLESKPMRNLHCVMCGSAAMLTAVETARALGDYKGRALYYRNSGDYEFGDHDRVVGYGAFAIEEA